MNQLNFPQFIIFINLSTFGNFNTNVSIIIFYLNINLWGIPRYWSYTIKSRLKILYIHDVLSLITNTQRIYLTVFIKILQCTTSTTGFFFIFLVWKSVNGIKLKSVPPEIRCILVLAACPYIIALGVCKRRYPTVGVRVRYYSVLRYVFLNDLIFRGTKYNFNRFFVIYTVFKLL